MPRLPEHESCQRCGDDLTGFLRALGVCGPCMQTPPVPTAVPRATYGWRTQAQPRKETVVWRRR